MQTDRRLETGTIACSVIAGAAVLSFFSWITTTTANNACLKATMKCSDLESIQKPGAQAINWMVSFIALFVVQNNTSLRGDLDFLNRYEDRRDVKDYRYKCPKMSFVLLLARDLDNGVSKANNVPWHTPAWNEIWRRVTRDGLVAAGRKTAGQLGSSNVTVISKSWKPPSDQIPVYITGGRETVRRWMTQSETPNTIILARILGKYQCDSRVTDEDLRLNLYGEWASIECPGCRCTVYTKRGVTDNVIPHAVRGWHVETAYLDLCRTVLDRGQNRPDRTGTGTKSIFGRQIEFNLKYGFPLVTTKKTFWKGIVKELIWFLRGETDATILAKDGVKIWNSNTSRHALDARGLSDYREGDAGPVYGFQWRHWGAEYAGCDGPRTGGHDQLAALIRTLKSCPQSRRHIVSAWNVQDLEMMALPPCHVLFQCYVSNDRSLDLHLYQRSVDIGLGLPFNIASYALLTHLICNLVKLRPGRLIISMGDAHIYRDHLDAISEQIQRIPTNPPRLMIRKNRYERLDQFKETDIDITGYEPKDPIRMSMSV